MSLRQVAALSVSVRRRSVYFSISFPSSAKETRRCASALYGDDILSLKMPCLGRSVFDFSLKTPKLGLGVIPDSFFGDSDGFPLPSGVYFAAWIAPPVLKTLSISSTFWFTKWMFLTDSALTLSTDRIVPAPASAGVSTAVRGSKRAINAGQDSETTANAHTFEVQDLHAADFTSFAGKVNHVGQCAMHFVEPIEKILYSLFAKEKFFH